MKKVLLINAHQFYEGFSEGKLNKTMADVMQEELAAIGFDVTVTNDIYAFSINDDVAMSF